MFFNVVVHAVLFFGLDTWVLTPHMGRALGSFQHGVASQIMGIQLKIQEEGDWEYPLMEAVMEEAGFEEIGYNILKRHNRVAQYIAMWPILGLCKRTVRRLGCWVPRIWWEEEGIGLEVVRERTAAAADGEGGVGVEETVW